MLTLREIFKVRTREVDQHGKLKLSAVADYLQEAAARHTTLHGIGPFQLRTKNLFWVLSRLRIDIFNYPEWGENVIVKTWPKGSRQIVASRDFLLEKEDGSPVGVATSQWLLLNADTKKPCSLELVATAFPILPDVPPAIAEAPPKVPKLPRCDHRITHDPCFSDIDLNDHLNNTRYVDWAIDALPPTVQDRQITSLAVNYLSEIKYGETTTLTTAAIDGNTFDTEGEITASGVAAFRTRIIFSQL